MHASRPWSRRTQGDHARRRKMTEVRRGQQVDADVMLPGRHPIGVVSRRRRMRLVDRGVVHQHVDTAKLIEHRVHKSHGIRRIGYISTYQYMTSTGQARQRGLRFQATATVWTAT